MAYYDYLCEACGLFTENRPMVQSADPCACPSCGTLSPRAFVRAPNMARMDGGKRHAMDVNEISSNTPRLSSETGKHPPRGANGIPGRSKILQHANGTKMAPSARPWMLGH